VFCGVHTLDFHDIEWAGSALGIGLEDLIQEYNQEIPSGASYTSGGRKMHVIGGFRRWYLGGPPYENIPVSSKADYFMFTGKKDFDARYAAPILLAHTITFRATDPRDKIFAMLGILKKLTSSSAPFITIDYNLSAAEVYVEATRAILQLTGWLGFLCQVDPSGRDRDPKLPSWVPGFSIMPATVIGGLKAVHAGASTIVPPPPSARTFIEKTLGLTGCRVAVVKARSEVLDNINQGTGDLEAGIQLLMDIPMNYHWTKENRVQAFWKTMIASGFDIRKSVAMQQSFASWWLCHWIYRAGGLRLQLSLEEYLKSIPNVQLLAEATDAPNQLAGHDAISKMYRHWITQTDEFKDLERSAAPFNRAFSSWTGSRRVFSTNQGHLGLGFDVLEEGDEVWVTPKTHVPFILRRVSEGEKELHFRFIGECYVHGIMEGEFFEQEDPVWQNILLV
jgi:hypothetical protein